MMLRTSVDGGSSQSAALASDAAAAGGWHMGRTRLCSRCCLGAAVVLNSGRRYNGVVVRCAKGRCDRTAALWSITEV